MLSRHQLLARSLALLLPPSPLVKLNQESKVGEEYIHARYRKDIPYYYGTLRDMLIHKIIGSSPGPGPGCYAVGHAWLAKWFYVRKFIDEYYAKHHLLPIGIRTVPRSSGPRVIDFDMFTKTLKSDLESANLSDYPKWTGVEHITGLSRRLEGNSSVVYDCVKPRSKNKRAAPSKTDLSVPTR